MKESYTERLLRKSAEQWAEAESNIIFFIEHFCNLKDQSTGRAIPFILWPDQILQINAWENNDRIITLKTRQIGVSWLSAAFALHELLFKNFFEIRIISRKEDTASEYLDKLKFMYDRLPDLYQELIPKDSDTKLKLELKNGSKIIAESSNPNAGRSNTLNLFIFDEAAFCENANTIWTAAEPGLEKANGKAFFISTANGYDDFFQPKWDGAKRNINGFTPVFISWKGDPNRTQEWYNRKLIIAKDENREDDFYQEYPVSPEQAFRVTGNTVFDSQIIKEYIDRLSLNPPQSVKTEMTPKGKLIKTPKGNLTVYEYPEKDSLYCIAADVAEGLEKGDFSTCTVYKREPIKGSYNQVAEFRDHIDTDQFGKFLFNLGILYNKALLAVEMNNHGESVMNVLAKEKHYPNIYRQMRYDEIAKKKVKKIGWKTTMTTKPVMIDTLKSMLRERSMNILSLEALSEFKTFVRQDAGLGIRMGAFGKNHDDLVIAHALASVVLLEHPAPKPHHHNIYAKKDKMRSPFKTISKRFNQNQIMEM